MNGHIVVKGGRPRHECQRPTVHPGDRAIWRCACGTYWITKAEGCWESYQPGPYVRLKALGIRVYEGFAEVWRG